MVNVTKNSYFVTVYIFLLVSIYVNTDKKQMDLNGFLKSGGGDSRFKDGSPFQW